MVWCAPIRNIMLKLRDTWIKFIIISISSTTWKSLRSVKRIILGNETSEQDLEDLEDNVPLKELVRRESAQPENVSATERKCYEEYIGKTSERLQTKQEETVREKSAPKGKDSVAKGKTDCRENVILDLVDITKQHQTGGAKEGASKGKLDITSVQSGKADPPQPGQRLDLWKAAGNWAFQAILKMCHCSSLTMRTRTTTMKI